MNVLSNLLIKAASARHIGYHPKCKNIGLTHLSFADDIFFYRMDMWYRWRVLSVFLKSLQEYQVLRLVWRKSTIYFAGVSERMKDELSNRFQFNNGQLSIRYLRLPHIIKNDGEWLFSTDGKNLNLDQFLDNPSLVNSREASTYKFRGAHHFKFLAIGFPVSKRLY